MYMVNPYNLLPNLFTTLNLLCGFFAIISVINGDFFQASWAILFAIIFDVFDGRIKRRQYYGLLKYSSILMTYGVAAAKKEKYKNLIVYSAINKFLRANKILAPKLYAHNYPRGIIVIEDFGDLSFYKVLLKKKNKFTFIIYRNDVNRERILWCF